MFNIPHGAIVTHPICRCNLIEIQSLCYNKFVDIGYLNDKLQNFNIKNISCYVGLIFIVIGLFWGLVFLLMNPPFQAADEDSHLFKIWTYTQGSYTNETLNRKSGFIIPKSMEKIYKDFHEMKHNIEAKTSLKKIKQLSHLPLDKNNTIFLAEAVPSYTILSYIPQTFVLFWLKMFNIPPLYMIYILRFCSLMVYLAITYQAIKITPYRKWLFAVIALLPTNLYIAASINQDCLVISCIYLLIAYTLRLKFSDNIQKITNTQILLWGTLYTYICIMKFLYFPLALLFFILPKNKFENTKSYMYSFLKILISGIIFIAIFLFFSVFINEGISNSAGSINELFNDMFFHIIVALFVLIRGFIYTTKIIIATYGWIPPATVSGIGALVYYFIIFLNCFYDENKKNFLTIYNKFILFFISIMCYLMFVFSLYILYKAYYSNQGRYITPYLPLIIMLFTVKKFIINNKFIPYITIIIMQIFYVYSVFVLIERFYLF